MQYISYIKENKKCYWEHIQQQQVIIVTTLTILQPCLDVVLVEYVHDIPRSICNRNQSKQDLQRHPICLNDSDHNYILEKIERK